MTGVRTDLRLKPCPFPALPGAAQVLSPRSVTARDPLSHVTAGGRRRPTPRTVRHRKAEHARALRGQVHSCLTGANPAAPWRNVPESRASCLKMKRAAAQPPVSVALFSCPLRAEGARSPPPPPKTMAPRDWPDTVVTWETHPLSTPADLNSRKAEGAIRQWKSQKSAGVCLSVWGDITPSLKGERLPHAWGTCRSGTRGAPGGCTARDSQARG